jgi:hypothetical protein
MRDGRLQVVDDERLGHAAEVSEGVFQAAEEVFRRLRERRFAVRLAAMAQHDAEDVRLSPPAIGRDDRRSCAEVHLRFFAGATLHPPEGERRTLADSAHVPLDAVVAAAEALLGDQVLPDPLGAELLIELGQDQLAVNLALARPATR